jgi:hypothetical protein
VDEKKNEGGNQNEVVGSNVVSAEVVNWAVLLLPRNWTKAVKDLDNFI